MEDWETDGNGNFKMLRFHGYESATAPGNVLLRLLYLSDDVNQLSQAPASIQFALTPELARKFADDLIVAVEQAEKGSTAS